MLLGPAGGDSAVDRKFDLRSLDVRLTAAVLAAMVVLVLAAALREAYRWSNSRRLDRQQPFRPDRQE